MDDYASRPPGYIKKPGHLDFVEVIEDWRPGYHLGRAIECIYAGDSAAVVWFVRRAIEYARDPDHLFTPTFHPDRLAIEWGLSQAMSDALHRIHDAIFCSWLDFAETLSSVLALERKEQYDEKN